MPRNGSGTYSLPEPAFVPNTVISSAAVNDDFSDIATALTASLARDGQGGMTAVLPMDPSGFVYVNDTNTGVQRTAADTQAILCGGTHIVDILTSGVDVTGDIDATGTITSNGTIIMPLGAILPYGGSTAPTGWLLCFGQSLVRASYPALFTAIGTAYGSADGSHFSLPDCRGRVIAGKDDMGGTPAGNLTSTTMTPDGVTLGATGGEQTHSLTSGENGTHTHVASVTDSGHSHSTQIFNSNSGGDTGAQPAFGSGTQDALPATKSATTGISVTNANSGLGSAHNNVQPTIITNYIIYAGA